jgi:hypothetical protein
VAADAVGIEKLLLVGLFFSLYMVNNSTTIQIVPLLQLNSSCFMQLNKSMNDTNKVVAYIVWHNYKYNYFFLPIAL